MSTLKNACPKPKRRAPKPKEQIPRMSAKKRKQLGGKVFSTITSERKPVAKIGTQKAKRQARNAAYYKSPEWRAKKQAVHERDGFQCVEVVRVRSILSFEGEDLILGAREQRCPNRGEVVNGKQTSRGLVCEEVSYGHRGVEGYIDTCKTRCKDCDRRLTPLERINHAHGFQSQVYRGMR